MTQYEIRFKESPKILQIDLMSYFLTYEMVEEIIKTNEPSLTNLDWELYKKDKQGKFYLDKDSSEIE